MGALEEALERIVPLPVALACERRFQGAGNLAIQQRERAGHLGLVGTTHVVFERGRRHAQVVLRAAIGENCGLSGLHRSS